MNVYLMSSRIDTHYYIVAPSWTVAWDIMQTRYPNIHVVKAQNLSRGAKVLLP